MKWKIITRNVVITFGLFVSQYAFADVLLIEPVRQIQNMDVPANGMSMNEVEERFGAPSSRHSAVGQPPITRWDYERWSVFFEYSTVLYSVLHKGEVLGTRNQSGQDDENDSG